MKQLSFTQQGVIKV